MYLLPSGVTGNPDNMSTATMSVPSATYHDDVSVDPCTEHMSHTLWSNESHPLSYLANSRPTEAVKRYAELLNERPMDQSETGRRVVFADDAAQPFVRRRNHTTYGQMNGRTLPPKISCL